MEKQENEVDGGAYLSVVGDFKIESVFGAGLGDDTELEKDEQMRRQICEFAGQSSRVETYGHGIGEVKTLDRFGELFPAVDVDHCFDV